MKKSLNRLISFSAEGEDSQNIIGFKIMGADAAKKFMKAVRLLEEQEAEMIVNGSSRAYSSECYSAVPVTQAEINVLEKTIGLEMESFFSNTVGVFPDALSDAYDTGLMREDEDEEDGYGPEDYDDGEDY